MQQTPTYTDPVCHMLLTTASAAGTSDYKGKTYYFCSLADKAAFDKEPEKYIKTVKIKEPMAR